VVIRSDSYKVPIYIPTGNISINLAFCQYYGKIRLNIGGIGNLRKHENQTLPNRFRNQRL
jgi:hypothetical protein